MPKLATFKPLTNRADSAAGGKFSLPEDGFVQLVPLGEAPNILDKKRIIQVIDAEALTTMMNSLLAAGADMLIDDDHLSHEEGKPTDANGWHLANSETLQLRDDGLYGLPRWSDLGLSKLIGGIKRFISPEFSPHTVQHLGGNRYRVTQLTGLALTNRPNFRGLSKPLTNSGRQQLADNPEINTMHKTLLALALGLPETEVDTLDEPTLRNRVQDFKKKCDAADATIAQAKKDNEAAADAFITKHAKVLANKDVQAHVRTTFLTNRAVAEAIVQGMTDDDDGMTPAERERAGKQPLHNRDKAQTPALLNADREADALHNRALTYRDTHKVSYEQALAAVRHQPAA